jgi:predicted metal-dependent hydrolase
MWNKRLINNTKIIELKTGGTVLLEKSKRARHLRISIRPFKGVRVSVPYSLSFSRAEEFVRINTQWIIKHRQRMQQVEQQHQKNDRQLSQLDRPAARRMLIKRLQELAGQNGFSFNRVFIRNQKTLWGSCSAKNNINLNQKLAGLPEQLMDYVILHELVHTRIKNHSRLFWNELAKYILDPKATDKELRKCGFIDRL